MSTTPIEVKIAALLSQAESTDNEHERETFSRKAEELMIKHGVDEAMLAAANTQPERREAIVEKTIFIKGNLKMCDERIYIDIAQSTGWARPLVRKSWDSTVKIVILVGFASDVDRTIQLATSIIEQASASVKAWWKGNKWQFDPKTDEGWYARRTFKFSFSQAVRTRLSNTLLQITNETGSALAVRDRGALVDDWMNSTMKIGKARRGGNSRGGGYAASVAGHAAGQKATFTKGAIG